MGGGRSKFKCCCNYAIKNFNWNSYQWQSDQKRYVKLIRRRITAQLRRGAGWLKIWPLITAIPVMEIFARVAWVTHSRRCCCCYTQQWLNGGSLCVCTKSSAYVYMCVCVYVIVVDVDAGVGVRLRQFCVVWAARRSASVYQFCWWWHFSCRHCLWVFVCMCVCVCVVCRRSLLFMCARVLSTSTVLPFAFFFFQLIVRLLLDDVTDVCLICLICVNLIVAWLKPTHNDLLRLGCESTCQRHFAKSCM